MRRPRGFTVIELMVTVAIIAVVTALSYTTFLRGRPRADLMSATAELDALLRGARQNALSTGRSTVVLVFPAAANGAGGVGRFVVYEDALGTFFSATAAISFGNFDPSKADGGFGAAAFASQLGSVALTGALDLPRGVTLGLGGAAVPTLPAPYSAIVPGACSFCATAGDGRGAIAFDARGRALFYNANGAPLAAPGATLALQGSSEITGYRLLVITATTGGVQALNNG